jgi:hypothetical protein
MNPTFSVSGERGNVNAPTIPDPTLVDTRDGKRNMPKTGVARLRNDADQRHRLKYKTLKR